MSLLLASGIVGRAAGAAADTRPRLLITSDIGGDADDQQSWIRFLSYSNEFRVVGLVASASGTPGELGDPTPQPDLIEGHVNNYGSVRSNLAAHASGYPLAADLLAMIKEGYDPPTASSSDRLAANLSSSATPPSNPYGDAWSWIIAKVDESSEPLHIAIWGGAFDTAQAIRSAGVSKGNPSAAFTTFKSKLRIYAIADQDGDTVAWIRDNHTDVRLVLSGPSGSSSTTQQFRGMYQNDSDTGIELVASGLFDLVYTPWVQTHVHGHGALGDGYPTNVSQLPNTTNNHTQAEGGGIKEGDTPSWFYVLPNGLNFPEQPTWGGWGGRFALVSNNHYTDTNGLDDSSEPVTNGTNTNVRRKWPVARWRQEVSNDFRARMDWCDTATFVNANHNPVAVLNGEGGKAYVAVAAAGGATVNLSAAGSTDPDGNTLSYSWSHYKGVGGSHTGTISITGATSQACSFTAPNVNTTVHIILKVTDNGTPNLTSYRRAVVTVTA
jgi:hypothetical protein